MKADTNADRTFPFNRAANFMFRPELDLELRIKLQKTEPRGLILNKHTPRHAIRDRSRRNKNQTLN